MTIVLLLAIIGIIFGPITQTRYTKSSIWLDLIITVIIGVIYAAFATDWFSLFYLKNSSILYADFIEYCNGVSAPRPLDAGVSNKRSALPMLLPRYFYEQNGIFDALAFGAIVAQIAMGSCFYLWGRIAHSRTLGLLLVLLAFIPAPMNFVGRILSSYPTMSLIFMIGATLSLWGIRSKNPSTMIASGIGIALILLADTRGLVWAIPLFGISLVTTIFRGCWKAKLLRLISLVLPVFISYQYADQVYVFDAIGIEPQVDLRPSLYRWVGLYPPPWDYSSNFTWGMKPLTDLRKTVLFLLEQAQLEVPESLVSFEIERGRYIAQYYFNFALVGLLFISAKAWKDHWLSIAIISSVLPFLMTFRGALSMLEEHPRFYIQTLPGVIVCWGFFCLGVVRIGSLFSRHSPLRSSKASSVAVLLLGLLCVFGVIPSFVSPEADWRRNWQGKDEQFTNLLTKYNNGSMHRDINKTHCRKALEKNKREGRPQHPTLYRTPLHKAFLNLD